MVVQELIEARQFGTGRIAIALILTPVIAVLLVHERVGILPDLFANGRLLPQEFRKSLMLLDEVLVVHKRRVFAKLLGNFAMGVEELVEARQFGTGCIAI